jgi:hypothetical protein
MGRDVANMSNGLHIQPGGGIGYRYQVGSQIPSFHGFSPAMTKAQFEAILSDADVSKADWLNAMPGAVKIWMNNRPIGEQDAYRILDIEEASVRGL